MRGLRSTLALLLLFLAIGGYAWFIERERPPASETDANEQAFDVEADQITALTVTADNGDVTALSRAADGDTDWTVTAPVDTAADGNAAAAIASSLAALEIRRVVDEDAAELSVFGLAEPTVTVEFGTADGAPETLAVGDETPTGGERYATIGGGPGVILIPGFVESTFNRTTLELRDRSVLEFTGPDVTSLTIEQGGGALRFTKADGDWRIADPLDARADFGLVEGMVGRIGSAEMVAVSSEAAGDEELEPFGLDAPRLTTTIEVGGDAHTLLVGDENPESTVYARDASRAMVFTIDAALVDDLARAAETYRQKDLFDFRPFNATALTVERDGGTMRFEKGPAEVPDDAGADGEEDGPAGRTPAQTRRSGGGWSRTPAMSSRPRWTSSSARCRTWPPSRSSTAAREPASTRRPATVTVGFGAGQQDRVVIGRTGRGRARRARRGAGRGRGGRRRGRCGLRGRQRARSVQPRRRRSPVTEVRHQAAGAAVLLAVAALAACVARTAPVPVVFPGAAGTAPEAGTADAGDPALGAMLDALFTARPPGSGAVGRRDPVARPERAALRPQPRRVADAGVDDEDRHAGGRRRAARMGRPLRDDARGRRADPRRDARGRPRRAGDRRPDDQRARDRGPVRGLGRRAARTGRAPDRGADRRRRRPAGRRQRGAGRRLRRRLGLGRPGAGVRRAGRRAPASRERGPRGRRGRPTRPASPVACESARRPPD